MERESRLLQQAANLLAKADLVPGMIFAGGDLKPDHCFFILRAKLNALFGPVWGLFNYGAGDGPGRDADRWRNGRAGLKLRF